MGLPGLPKLDLDVGKTVGEFLGLLRGMDEKLGELLAIERAREAREIAAAPCQRCEEVGSLRCERHGPIMVPKGTSLDAD